MNAKEEIEDLFKRIQSLYLVLLGGLIAVLIMNFGFSVRLKSVEAQVESMQTAKKEDVK